ncbi:MAG: Omp28-related outer membrane protein [Flavobacteriales bacterium]
MKKILLAMLACMAIATVHAQSFSDDFESYNAGDPLASTSDTWESWGSPDGGADDADVTDAMAHSGTKSVYFASTAAAGGPQDIVLPFPGEMTVGQFNLEMWMYINSAGTGAYFNFQQEDVIGTTWAADVYFLDGGIAQFTSGGTLLLAASFPEDAWFKLRMENDLSTNTWEVLVDDVSQGSYANTATQIASMDIYPVQNNQFYVDDVSYEYVPYTVPAVNGTVTNINQLSANADLMANLAGQTVAPQVVVRNLGITAINSFDLEITYNGNTITENVTGVNIASLAFYPVSLTDNFTLIAGENDAVATISNVNGNATDDDASDDEKVVNVDPIVPAPGKAVVAEEGTGTWCPWCVRGTVFMERLSEHFGDLYIGIAVHNADPMAIDTYDGPVSASISGYPSGFVDRGPEYDPSQFQIPFLERVQTAPKVAIQNGATWDAATRVLNVSATSTFLENVSGNYKVALVLTEDGVTGTGSQWAQANAYAGGGNGDMGGYEDLPSPVPANQMVYDHVARVISPTFEGLPGAFAGMQDANDASTHNFWFTLPAGWDENSIHIIAMVIAPDGTIENAMSTTIDEAVANGFVAGTVVTGITETAAPDANFNIYPNPASDVCFVTTQFENATEVNMEVYSTDGKLVASKYYGKLTGANNLPINTAEWAEGIYTLKMSADGQMTTKKLIKN